MQEGHHLEPPPHASGAAHLWQVVRCNNEGELRLEGEEIATQNRAVISSPPEIAFSFASSQRRPSSISGAITSRAAASPASSVECLSPWVTVKVSMGALVA